MGNTVASEGEEMAESPRVAIGEISNKKRKHRSFRKRMMDKFKKTKDVLPQKEYKDDPPQNEPPKQEDVKRRRNYYKQLGIVQRGSAENKNDSFAAHKMMSCLDIPSSEQDNMLIRNKSANERSVFQSTMVGSCVNEEMKFEEASRPQFNQSLSSLAMRKGKAITSGNFDEFDAKRKLRPSRSSSNLRVSSKYKMDQNRIKRDRSESPSFGGNAVDAEAGEASTKASLANRVPEAQATTDGLLEEEKVEKITEQDTEGFKINVFQTQKSMADMRNKFLCKLAQERIWLTPDQKPKSHQTCIIFDWDDTLLCTTFLNPTNAGNFDLPLNVKLQLK